VKGPILSALDSTGRVFVSFDDSRDATRALHKIQLLYPDWRVIPLTSQEYALRTEGHATPGVSDFDGTVRMSLKESDDLHLDRKNLASFLKEMAEGCGDLRIFESLPLKRKNLLECKAEFYSARDADNAVRILDGAVIQVGAASPILPPQKKSNISSPGICCRGPTLYTGRWPGSSTRGN
jgi:hypothetical protein